VTPPAAILDIDGTRVDTNYQHALAWYRAFRQHGVILPIWRIHRHMGMGGDQLVESIAGERVEREQGDDIRTAERALYLALIERHALGLQGGRRGRGGDHRGAHRWLRRGGADRRRCGDGFESIDEMRKRLGETPLAA
jgi:hypothetical protein